MPTDAIATLISKLIRIGPPVWAERAARVAELFFREQRNIAIARRDALALLNPRFTE